MYSTLVWIALTGLAAPAESTQAPSWQSDYNQALKIVGTQQKPMVVIIASGEAGWQKMSQTGKLDNEANRLLAENYVCAYVDSSTPQGKKLASDFAIPGGLGIIISDRTGQLQAFYHEGDLSDQALRTYLTRFADPNRPVSFTETNPSHQTSSYCPTCSSCANGNCRRR